MSREILQNIINNFDLQKFRRFFSEKNRKFRPSEESLNYYNDEIFSDGKKLGEISFEDGNLLVCVFEVKKELTERSGKKAQYDLGKKILKETQTDAGIFIFYNKDGRFRFSLIYTNYLPKKRDWSAFKRFTYFVSSDPQVTNKTFLQRIGDGDFSSLENVKETFSVEKVTKDFFKDIANWYFWAVKHVHFPKDAPKEADGHDHVGVIRMITRLIFCWFVKEKGLIPGELFDQRRLDELLDGFSPDKDDEKDSVFYKAILQNLFFATLNTEMDKRGWARDGQNFMAHSLYRYSDLFKKPDEALSLFRNIPFLNGGLFECLDKDLGKNAKTRYVRIDGFSRRPESQPVVPDFLFFGPEREEDLSAEYGNRKFRRVRVRGLIHTLRQYHFTIEENTPIEQEIALDPELSGKVFENLLAAYNPETGATARKQTGSFYTPREIVDYMVDEALIAYLKMKLEANQSSTDNIEERLRHLFAYNDEEHLFSTEEVDILIDAIDHLKALDPAVGSGAFPMGILHKLVFILGKLDPRNEQWKQRQIRRVRDAIAAAEKIEDSAIRERTVKELEQQITGIEEAFERNEMDYGRKLYLIENCLYGVDIQSIAVQIAKMRFFISLIVDQRVDPDAANLGVRPLPNLETKFVAANTLIGIEKPKQMLLRNTQIDAKEAELRRVREKHFIARTLLSKEKCREQDKQLRAEIAELLKSDGWGNRIAKKLAGWDPYDQNASAPFFDPEWMFGVRDGFDVVIGNPPYVQLQKDSGKFANMYKNCGYKTFERTGDIYTLFYENGINHLKQDGYLCFITSNKWMRAGYGKSLRSYFLTKNPYLLIDLGPGIFENATVDTNILIIQNAANNNSLKGLSLSAEAKDKDLAEYVRKNAVSLPKMTKDTWFIGNAAEQSLKEKIEQIGKPLKEWDVKIYRGVLTGLTEAFIVDNETKERLCEEDPKSKEILKPILRGRDIKRYGYEWSGLWLIASGYDIDVPKLYPAVFNHLKQYEKKAKKRDDQGLHWWNLRSCAYYPEFEKEKVVWSDIATTPSFSILPAAFFFNNTAYMIIGRNNKYCNAILNSKIVKWFFPLITSDLGDKGQRFFKIFVENLPIPPITPSNHNKIEQIEELVEKILKMKKIDADTAALEQDIDQLVYELYELTEDEIAIVEKDS